MRVQKIIRANGEWAEKGVDVKDNDIVTILDEGQIVTGDYGDGHVFKIETRNGEKNLRFNQTSMNNLIDVYGEETKNWIGKRIKVFMIKAMVSGKLQDVTYLAHQNATMQNDGSFLSPASDDIPVINTTGSVEDINSKAQLASEYEKNKMGI